jgi:formylglycine-generating enzyme required for sulfatase activity
MINMVMHGAASFLCVAAMATAAAAQTGSMVKIPSGTFAPLYAADGESEVRVGAFELDRRPVTRGDFLVFVRAHPEWRRSRVHSAVATRETYLADWPGDLDAGDARALEHVVTGVSWHAARAYCAAQPGGKRLPTLAEWEYVARASRTSRNGAADPEFRQHVATLYATRSLRQKPVHAAELNAFGVQGMHDQVWEWVADVNEEIAALHHSAHTRHGAGAAGHDLSCSGAALGAADPRDYPAFLRYAMRAVLSPTSAGASLGFRCAR